MVGKRQRRFNWPAFGARPYANNKWTHKTDGGCVLFADGHVAWQREFRPPMYNGKNP